VHDVPAPLASLSFARLRFVGEFGAFTMATDICGDGGLRYHTVARYHAPDAPAGDGTSPGGPAWPVERSMTRTLPPCSAAMAERARDGTLRMHAYNESHPVLKRLEEGASR
jgi:hypothetical protein